MEQSLVSRNVDLEEEMEELHLSRKDNPYLSSCEALDDPDFGDEPGSPLPRYTVYNSVQCTVYVQCTMYNVQCTVYSVQCTMYSVQCTVYTVECYAAPCPNQSLIYVQCCLGSQEPAAWLWIL